MRFEEQLKSIITALSDSITNETVSENQETVDKLKALYEQGTGNFLDTLESGMFKFDMLLEEVFAIPPQKNQHLIKFIANGLYEEFHKKRIYKLEGMSCSADKSSFIKRMTLRALQEQQNYSLYADYTNVEQIKEDKERQAYWSPTTVKDTDEAMQLFWDWYNLIDYKNSIDGGDF